MIKRFLWCFALVASWALAQPAPKQDVAKAREGCARLKARFEALRAYPSDKAARAKRGAELRELWKLQKEARKVHARQTTRLQDSPGGSNAGSVEVQPIHALSVVGECGGGSLLASVHVQVHDVEYFLTGYIQKELLLPGPPSCEQVSAWLREAPHRPVSRELEPVDTLYTAGNAVTAHEGPDPEAAVLQKLGYGVEVNAVSGACPGWILIASPYGGGYGFVEERFLPRPGSDAATRREQPAQAPSTLEQAAQALYRAHASPNSDKKEALALLQKARESLSPTDQGRCENFVGVCDVLLEDSLYMRKRLEVDPKVGEVPVGPWWILISATEPARPAVFRSAHVYTSGECNCGGCETCQTNLELVFETLNVHEPVRYLAASRRPPPSWFRSVSNEGCAEAEQIAKKSPRWDVPRYGGDPKKPAAIGEGTCIPGDDGSVWWQQAWRHPEMAGSESSTVLRTYRIHKGKVVEVGKLSAFSGDGTKTLTWTTDAIVAWRDLDGDGRSDRLVPCTFGRYCTQAKGFARPARK